MKIAKTISIAFILLLLSFIANRETFAVPRNRILRDGRVVYVLPPNVPEGEARVVMAKMRAALAPLAKDFPAVSSAPLRVLLTSDTGDFTVRADRPVWIGADYDNGVITLQPVRLLRRLGFLDQTICHEAAHHALFVTARDRVPAWLAEGYCERGRRAAAMKNTKTFESLAALTRELENPKNAVASQNAYAVASLFVKWLERKKQRALVRIIRATGRGGVFDSEFKKEFGAVPDAMFRKMKNAR